MLKVLVTKEEFQALPELIRAEYKEKGDKYTLDSDASDYVNKIDGFRTNNIELRKKVEVLIADAERYKDVDVDKYKEALAKLDEIEEQRLIDADKIEEVIAMRTERMRSDSEGRLTAMEASLNTERETRIRAETTLEDELRGNSVMRAVPKVAVPKLNAMPIIENLAKETWKYVEGKLTPMNGDEVIYGKDGKAELTMTEWVQSIVETNDFLFEGNKGAGARGNGGNGAGNPGVIDRHDGVAFSSNLERIASGEIKAQ